jgi:O-antigen/teichoic acid export membrane protein
LLLVRILDKPQFAAYAIAASLFVTLNVLTDCGIGTGLNALGGRVWRDRAALGSLVASALGFRARLAWFALPLGAGFGLFLFRQNAVAWSESIPLTFVALSGLWGIATTNTYAVALRLAGKYLEVQKLELTAALVRLGLLTAMTLLFINAIVAILAAAISVTVQAIWIHRKAASILDDQAPPNPVQYSEISRFVRSQWFSTCFFAFQGQITIWVMSLFGTPEKVAEVGALGRLAVLFGFIASLLNGIATPTLARCDSPPRLHRLFGAMLLAYALFACTLLAASFIFPREILFILGGPYAGLANELPFAMGTSVLWGLTGVFYALASARGWIWQAWISPLVTIALQVVLLRSLDLTQVRGVLVFGLLGSLPVLLSVASMVARGLAKGRREAASCCSG